MSKITSIYSREWRDVIGFILQKPRSGEFFISIPIRYWSDFQINSDKPYPAYTSASNGFKSVSCSVENGDHYFTLKSGEFQLNVHPNNEICGYIRLDLDCPPSDHGHVVVRHLVDDDEPIHDTLKRLRTEIRTLQLNLSKEEAAKEKTLSLEEEFSQHRDYIIRLIENAGLSSPLDMNDVSFNTINTVLRALVDDYTGEGVYGSPTRFREDGSIV